MFIGKALLTMLGLRFGGLPGAALGLIVGHLVDMWLAEQPWAGALPWVRRDHRQRVFVESVTILAAKLAKVDGPVTAEEIRAFRSSFQLPSDLPERVGDIYNRAKETAQGFEPAARRLADQFGAAPALLAAVLDALVRIAAADGPINQAENEYLDRVSRLLGLGARSFAADAATQAGDPYAVLGVARDAPIEAVKTAWRKLSRQFHPDMLMAKGLSADQVAMATRKMAEINAAYDRILAERGAA